MTENKNASFDWCGTQGMDNFDMFMEELASLQTAGGDVRGSYTQAENERYQDLLSAQKTRRNRKWSKQMRQTG